MSSASFCLLLIISLECMISSSTYMGGSVVVANSIPADATTSFIRASCKATLYPALCFQMLSSHATEIQQNEHKLAQTALSVTLAKAQSTTLFVSRLSKLVGIKPREYQAVKDCIDNMHNTINQLNHSIQEFDQVAVHQEFMWHMSNVQTWVSAALTYENTCVDGFAGHLLEGMVKAAINKRVIVVAQVTSNALALINHFVTRRQATNTHPIQYMP